MQSSSSPIAARRRRLTRPRVIKGAVIVSILVASVVVVKECRYYFIPKNFGIVESGAIYRGGCQTPRVLRNILQKYHIRTVVNLDDQILDYDGAKGRAVDRYAAEKAIAGELGIRYVGFVWEGTGLGPFGEYDAAADILASTYSQPVFLHCSGGKRRTNAALAAYWIRHCGYTFEQVVERLSQHRGFNLGHNRRFFEHLRKYYEYSQHNPRSGAKAKGMEKSPGSRARRTPESTDSR